MDITNEEKDLHAEFVRREKYGCEKKNMKLASRLLVTKENSQNAKQQIGNNYRGHRIDLNSMYNDTSIPCINDLVYIYLLDEKIRSI